MALQRALVLAALLFCPVAARASEPAPVGTKYYILLFGGQAEKNRPQTAHTWATFVQGVPYSVGGGSVVETFTISWLPEQLPVKPFKLRPVAGRNYGLEETLTIFNTGRSDLSLWGPFEIREEWYLAAAAHKRELDSGAVRFATLDRGPFLPSGRIRHPDISHCVHAVSRTWEPLRRASNPVNWYGELITRKLADAMDEVGLLVKPCITHNWLIRALDVQDHAVQLRRVHEPLLGLLR